MERNQLSGNLPENGGIPMPVSESQLRAAEKWESENCKRLSIKFKNAEFESLEAFCKQNGISKNGFVRQAVAEAIQRASESSSR